MLIAWVWQDAIPSYEKATLLDGKRGFFYVCLCYVCHPHRPTQTSAPTDADIRIDRRRHPHRPTQTSVSTDADGFSFALHALRHLDTEQRHAVLQRLANVLSKNEAHHLLLFGVGTEDRVVVVELVECLCQLIAVVGDAAW